MSWDRLTEARKRKILWWKERRIATQKSIRKDYTLECEFCHCLPLMLGREELKCFEGWWCDEQDAKHYRTDRYPPQENNTYWISQVFIPKLWFGALHSWVCFCSFSWCKTRINCKKFRIESKERLHYRDSNNIEFLCFFTSNCSFAYVVLHIFHNLVSF